MCVYDVNCCACVTVKAFLAQAKEEFTRKWDEPPQVCLPTYFHVVS